MDEWKTEIAGDNADTLKSLEGFESLSDFGSSYFETKTKLDELSNQDWRASFAGEDEKAQKMLARFNAPQDFTKSYFEAAERIRAGDVLKPLPEDATEEDIKVWREQQGIPLEANGYLEELPEGLVIGENDKDIVSKFAEKMHSVNASPAQVHAGLQFYTELQTMVDEEQAELDKKDAEEVAESLRDEWGNDYRANMNIAKALVSDLPEEAQDRFLNARTSEGKALFNDPDIVKWLTAKGRELNPAAAIMPPGKTDDASILERKAFIESKMGSKEYDARLQAEYSKIITALAARGAIDEHGNVKAA